jgi:hypothetical protein
MFKFRKILKQHHDDGIWFLPGGTTSGPYFNGVRINIFPDQPWNYIFPQIIKDPGCPEKTGLLDGHLLNNHVSDGRIWIRLDFIGEQVDICKIQGFTKWIQPVFKQIFLSFAQFMPKLDFQKINKNTVTIPCYGNTVRLHSIVRINKNK